jgi:hypothetical protein
VRACVFNDDGGNVNIAIDGEGKKGRMVSARTQSSAQASNEDAKK